MQLKKLITVVPVAAALCVALAGTARADIILTAGNIPQDDENVLLNTGITGNPIFGETNQTHLSVRFTSDENLTAPSNGQARIEAADGAFTRLVVDLVGGSFTSLILNLDATANGTVDFFAMDTDGNVFSFLNRAVGENGQNFYTFTTLNGQRIRHIGFDADVPVTISDAAQFRIGGAQEDDDVTIPEPTTLSLLGIGLLGAAGAARRRRS